MAYTKMYAIFLFTVAAYRDSCRLFLREDVLIDLLAICGSMFQNGTN